MIDWLRLHLASSRLSYTVEQLGLVSLIRIKVTFQIIRPDVKISPLVFIFIML